MAAIVEGEANGAIVILYYGKGQASKLGFLLPDEAMGKKTKELIAAFEKILEVEAGTLMSAMKQEGFVE